MTPAEFWGYFSANTGYALMWIFFVGLFNYILFKRYVYSILDPLLLHLVMSVSGYSVVFFMFQLNLISTFFFLNFVLTQLSFYFGFLLIKPISLAKLMDRKGKPSILWYDSNVYHLYCISILLYSISQFAVYYSQGIPLLMEARLDVYMGGSGFGIFGRIIYVCEMIISSIAIYHIIFVKRKTILLDVFVLIWVLLNAILSGSKSAFMSSFFVMFFVILFNYKTSSVKTYFVNSKVKKYGWIIFVIALGVSIFVIDTHVKLIYGKGSGIEPLAALMMRIVNTGNIYYYAYPDSLLFTVKHENSVLALFSSVIGALRILPWEELPKSIGLQLHQSMFNTDIVSGPNTRHNVFGLFYFGEFFSIIFSFFLGFGVSYLRNKLYLKIRTTVIGMLIFIVFAASSLTLEIDPVMGISQLLSIFLVFPGIYLVSVLLSRQQGRLYNVS